LFKLCLSVQDQWTIKLKYDSEDNIMPLKVKIWTKKNNSDAQEKLWWQSFDLKMVNKDSTIWTNIHQVVEKATLT